MGNYRREFPGIPPTGKQVTFSIVQVDLAQQGHSIIGIARNLPKEPYLGELITVDLANPTQTASVLAELTDCYSITGSVNNVC